MKIPILNLLLSLSFLSGFAADPKFPVSNIPEELKRDVNVVVREDKTVFTIHSRSTATNYSYYVATIFNSQGKEVAYKAVDYDKASKITKFKANVYDAAGNLIKKLKPSEFSDESAYDGFSLYSDNRYRTADLTQGSYPYTVEFEYEVEYKYLYHIDGTFLIPGEKTSVQLVSYQLIFPSELAPRYKTLNIDVEPTRSRTENGLESLSWFFENLKPVKFEPYGPKPVELLPRIMAAPGKFEYDGYVGNMNSWKEFGKWNALLNKDRTGLSEPSKQKIRDLTNGITSTEQKARVIYEYLQEKTRYVSIQEGVGGFQPFPASAVDETGYGDCKALSNYMVALLKEAGIDGYYTRVRAGKNEANMILDFPSQQTNHVIVSIPNGKDTLWLECTSQTNPFGYLGRFTGDRYALMITEDGGKIVKTQAYTAEQNIQLRTAEVSVKITGEASAKIKTIYSGLQYENDGLDDVLNNQYDLQKKWVLNTTNIPSFDVTSFKFENRKDKIPTAIVSLDLNLKRLATVSGKRIMLTPNLMNRNSFTPEKLENRETEIVRNVGFIDYDTIRYQIPEEIYPEFLPEPVKIKSRFGEYEASYKIDQGLVVYTRKMIVHKGRYPAASYQEFIDFYKSVSKADNAKLVFLNKT